jgi:hypothetical protein
MIIEDRWVGGEGMEIGLDVSPFLNLSSSISSLEMGNIYS